jgi:exopolysaccharide biosynthesis polyprenyl glycosylphosphotransferase
VLLITMFSFWWDVPLSPAWLALTWSTALLLELSARRLVRWRLRHLRHEGPLSLRTLLIGTNDEARQLADSLVPSLGFGAIGCVETSAKGQRWNGSLPILGNVQDLERTIRRQGAECLFVASTSVTSSEMLDIFRACRRTGIEMRISANLPQILTSRLTVQPIGKVMAVSVRPVRLSGAQVLLKRSFDLAASSLGLAVSLPLLILIAVAIRLTSRGPILFSQTRVTQGGRGFTMHKFRTMIPDADRVGEVSEAQLTQPFFKMENDPRLTKVGRILRTFSLDELPQLWNVLRGDMSLVGPRPLRAEQVAADPQTMSPRHEVRAGMTGWWQVHGRNDLSYEDALRLDIFYIENWSLGLDLYILLKTVGAVVLRRGAY